jgi:L,D-transpeptidase YcbB
MVSVSLFRQPLAARLAKATAVAVALLWVFAVMPARAGILDPLNPFGSSINSGPVSPEDRARREQARNELYNRLSPSYRMSVPFVSAAAVEALQQGVEKYRGIVAAGGWPAIPTGGNTLRLGDTDAAIVSIRRLLAVTDDLPGDGRSPQFDTDFQDGLARFQIRNGLRVSGFVDSRTLAALNVSAAERLKQLETNLVRVKSMLKINQAPRYVLVDVPAFTLQAIDHNNLALDSNVVVGKPARATPEVAARVVEVNFYPTWTVPDTIAQQDLIPKIRKDPSYFANEHFSVMASWKSPPLDPATVDWSSPQVASYKFVQDPGTFNALGVVRINMPNKYSVYMHDTPLKQLFSQSTRAFSSGCVRVERVLDLVAWLLGPQQWTSEKVEAAASGGQRATVTLTNPVPVHFVYLTAFVSDGGTVQFRPDIYGHDAPNGDDADDQGAVVAQQRSAVTP